ncbi:hypothetical protein D910_05760, partial [Dendroctonus ponderosae]
TSLSEDYFEAHTYLGVVKSLDTARRVSEIALQDGHPYTFTVHFKIFKCNAENRSYRATETIALHSYQHEVIHCLVWLVNNLELVLMCLLYIHGTPELTIQQLPITSQVPNKKVASERPEEADSKNFDPCEQCSVDFRITLLMLLLQDF